MAIPIWKDTFYTVPATASPYTYSIVCDGETIFKGRAWAPPYNNSNNIPDAQDNNINIGINRIAQDYLYMDFPDLSQVPATGHTGFAHTGASRTFYVYDEYNTLRQSYSFVLNWSYKTARSSTILSDVINGHGTNGMYYFSTTSNLAIGEESIVTTVSKNPDDVIIGSNPITRYDGNYCGEGALYYLDRNCGWCSFLIEGNITRRDEYTRNSITRSYNNTTLDRGKTIYNSIITPKWELHTTFMPDNESKKLAFNLFSANQVYFHDLREDRIYPVVISDTAVEYKTVKNQGRKWAQYTINVTAAQNQLNLG